MDIDVVEDLQGLKVEEEKALEKEEAEADELEIETSGRATDPVENVSQGDGYGLPTREGEVSAKRMRREREVLLGIVLSCPMAVKEVVNLGKAIKAGKVEIREVARPDDEEETNVEEERIRKEDFGSDRTDRRSDEGLHRLPRKREAPRGRIEGQKKKRAEILECFRQMNLRDLQINKMVQKMKQMLVRVERAELESRKPRRDGKFRSETPGTICER